ncbi:hypothetical protein [Mycolicibacter hiberniae]|uniref:Uncharacterized protein n=1 Tax=Mycolicibacter hiberniae TaxID=29314 RepID=A0A7I7X2T0_9MYCO|nr:hypothetical protein [Mycolicibacter hiberniae]MCV7088159.1 hypothetical protein [Mycolicibacter hiberniae]BBZ23904.1 hypothetical protein MHIB_23220 [Mycolicibacter hiberniae]
MSTETIPSDVITPEDGENPPELITDTVTDVSAGGPKPNREARYRVERNEARSHVEQLQRRDAERLAAKGLSNPADLFTLGGIELGELLDELGFVDPDKVSAVVSDILGSRPGLKLVDAPVDRSQGFGSSVASTGPTWGNLLRDRPGA